MTKFIYDKMHPGRLPDAILRYRRITVTDRKA